MAIIRHLSHLHQGPDVGSIHFGESKASLNHTNGQAFPPCQLCTAYF